MSRGRRSSLPPLELRHEIAAEAARFMVEHGIQDFGLAKRKAAERLGVRPAGLALPSNEQVQEQVVQWQRTFEPELSVGRLAHLRRLAVEAMEWLESFRPRLVGAVLDGTATITTAIELHVFSDAPEAVAAVLEERGLRPRDSQRRYRTGKDTLEHVPGFALRVEGEELAIMVFPERGSGHAPRSLIDGRPMRRASRAAVMALLESAH